MYCGLQSCQTSCRQSGSFLPPPCSPAWPPVHLSVQHHCAVFALVSCQEQPPVLLALQGPAAILFPPSLPHHLFLVAPQQQCTDTRGSERERCVESEDERKRRGQTQERLIFLKEFTGLMHSKGWQIPALGLADVKSVTAPYVSERKMLLLQRWPHMDWTVFQMFQVWLGCLCLYLAGAGSMRAWFLNPSTKARENCEQQPHFKE